MVGGELAFAVLGAGLGEPTVDLNGVSVAPEGFTGGGGASVAVVEGAAGAACGCQGIGGGVRFSRRRRSLVTGHGCGTARAR